MAVQRAGCRAAPDGGSGVTPAHLARGEWQISRVYTVLGRPEPALNHAHRVLVLADLETIPGQPRYW